MTEAHVRLMREVQQEILRKPDESVTEHDVYEFAYITHFLQNFDKVTEEDLKKWYKLGDELFTKMNRNWGKRRNTIQAGLMLYDRLHTMSWSSRNDNSAIKLKLYDTAKKPESKTVMTDYLRNNTTHLLIVFLSIFLSTIAMSLKEVYPTSLIVHSVMVFATSVGLIFNTGILLNLLPLWLQGYSTKQLYSASARILVPNYYRVDETTYILPKLDVILPLVKRLRTDSIETKGVFPGLDELPKTGYTCFGDLLVMAQAEYLSDMNNLQRMASQVPDDALPNVLDTTVQMPYKIPLLRTEFPRFMAILTVSVALLLHTIFVLPH